MIAPVFALALAATPCGLPALRPGNPPWRPGEQLGFDIDVMGVVQAGTMSLAVEPPMLGGSMVPIRAHVKNTSVFAKVRKVNALALSWLTSKTLRPDRYHEDIMEDGVHKGMDVNLGEAAKKAFVVIDWELGGRKATDTHSRRGEVLDLISAMYYLRAADLKPGQPICLDLAANRKLWHLEGTVAAETEKIESPAGIFETIRLDGVASRADNSSVHRPIHIWIGTDSRHLPVAAVSEIDLGPVRAMLARTR